MSVDQLLDEVEKLSKTDRELFFSKLGVHDESKLEETPEFIAFVEEGLRSEKEEPLIPLEDVVKEFKTWNTKST